jgi:hypothetical protein
LLSDSGLGTQNDYDAIIKAIFPPGDQSENFANVGEYRILMSYLRSSPLREPVRIEYFDVPHLQNPEEVIAPIYLMSLPYQEYGLPLILYYADKLARTPSELVRTVIEKEYLDIIINSRFSEPISIMQMLGKLTRNFFQRDGI